MRPSNNPGNTTLSDAYWRVQLACLKNQAHSSLSSLKPPLEYNQDQTLLMNQHLQAAELKRYSRFTIVENTISNSPRSWQPSFLEVMDSFVLVTYTSLVASKTLLLQLLTCLNFTLDSEDLLLVQMKKLIPMNYGISTRSWKSCKWVRLDLIFTMRDICISLNLNPLTKFTSSSSRRTKFKDILPRSISKMIAKTIPISKRIVISNAIKWGISHWVCWIVNGNWENLIRISQWRERHCRTNTSIRNK